MTLNFANKRSSTRFSFRSTWMRASSVLETVCFHERVARRARTKLAKRASAKLTVIAHIRREWRRPRHSAESVISFSVRVTRLLLRSQFSQTRKENRSNRIWYGASREWCHDRVQRARTEKQRRVEERSFVSWWRQAN